MTRAHTEWPLLAEWPRFATPERFMGHFPGGPIVPGAFLLDSAIATIERASDRRVTRVRQVKFLHPLDPAGSLRLHADIATDRASFVLTTGNDVVCTGAVELHPDADR